LAPGDLTSYIRVEFSNRLLVTGGQGVAGSNPASPTTVLVLPGSRVRVQRLSQAEIERKNRRTRALRASQRTLGSPHGGMAMALSVGLSLLPGGSAGTPPTASETPGTGSGPRRKATLLAQDPAPATPGRARPGSARYLKGAPRGDGRSRALGRPHAFRPGLDFEAADAERGPTRSHQPAQQP
jgi:hypothetical protein